MTIRVAIQHNTHYRFDRPVQLSPHTVRLRPAAHSRTPIHGYTLKVTPEKHFINWQQDPYGNYLARLVFPDKVTRLSVEVEVIADMTVINPFDFFLEEYAEEFPFDYKPGLKKELQPYLELVDGGPLLEKWLSTVPRESMRTNDFLVHINQRLANELEYQIRMEPGVQKPEETLALASGSCRDSGWLLVQIMRRLGLAARFTSGYLVQLTADVKSLDGPSGPEADFTDLHAWCEVFVPGAGWIGLDPTSGLFAGEGHIPLACTPSPSSAAPIDGAMDECEVEFEFSNTVARIHEDPRVTKPYTEEQWQTIKALGDFVDQELEDGDVRLTMGGEPTFVSVDDMESAQWNTGALGADKLRLAKDLILRLRDRFAPGGLLHYGQGKWYPGEPLPRWALGCFWRTDGEPVWKNQALLASPDKEYGATPTSSRLFIKMVGKGLGTNSTHVRGAYEDPVHHLMEEARLPANIDAEIANASDSADRRRLAKLLQRGLGEATGYVLPIAWSDEINGWESSEWDLRRGEVILYPGDSPMGLRLPLDSLPWVAKEDREPTLERDPFERMEPLAPHSAAGSTQTEGSSKRQRQQTPKEIAHTALCVEPRDGRLHIFMPPLQKLEHYLDLLQVVERTAAKLSVPVIIEGYPPPRDQRLPSLMVTPDPGVIEVNIHPAHDWSQLVATTETLYEEAHQARLGTEKFMLDGRHTGTGGGNHVTIGGATPADSPLLRRPELLRSLVTYWQHHPGLSYLFSGMFIGPTSQAPRVDEGRHEQLYELETAFQQMPDGEVPQPWLVDRLMRNLLVDITGNTHRSEFCIDKLYSPDSASGRQGLLEFRAFEMPPHARMSLVQMLLLRSLIARFWKNPYRKNLVRWGTALHDQFMLPHYAWRDVENVVQELRDAGIPFDMQWLAPFLEFRYPHYGRVQIGDINLQLQAAIEPWHVLGEEVGSFGTARYVDSSVERLQVKVNGLTPDRYVVACNGRRVPLRNTGTHGEYVAGVRYRAWAPSSALHPTIGVHAPLVFDLIDTWNGRSIGGCNYHVTHPGGRSYDTSPVNAFEAESRRINRFWGYGHTAGVFEPPPELDAIRTFFPHEKPPRPMEPPAEHPDPEYPHTLDLRRQPL